MKTIIKMTLTLLSIAVLTACGGGGGDGFSNSGNGTGTGSNTGTTPGTSVMVMGAPVAIDGGYSIVDASEDAVVDILVVGESRTATLTAGTASIQRQ